MSAEDILKQLDKDNIPRHIAIIMDGNGRWAQKKRMARIKGHVAGTKIIKELIRKASDLGVEVLTLYCFSTENWRRPLDEISFLMDLIRGYLVKEAESMVEEGVHLMHIGDLEPVPPKVKAEFDRVEAMTSQCDKITLNIAINYGSRQEILKAVKYIVQDCEAGKIEADTLDEAAFSGYLDTSSLPEPDLLIRTSGEQRISNYLLWQIAYTEIYFTNVHWPDFNEEELYKAILEYQHRSRRFGGI